MSYLYVERTTAQINLDFTKYIVKINLTCFFLLFLMRLLEKFKLPLWLTSDSSWEALLQSRMGYIRSPLKGFPAVHMAGPQKV
jgi:hypothetical protein